MARVEGNKGARTKGKKPEVKVKPKKPIKEEDPKWLMTPEWPEEPEPEDEPESPPAPAPEPPPVAPESLQLASWVESWVEWEARLEEEVDRLYPVTGACPNCELAFESDGKLPTCQCDPAEVRDRLAHILTELIEAIHDKPRR
jgi:hypothetical protein